jgi:Bacterial protein of unknown function (DUF885)
MKAWDDFVRALLQGYFERIPSFASSAGRHELDGKLPDWSPEAMAETVDWLRSQREQALAATGLGARRSVEREHVLAQLDSDLFWRTEADWPRRNPLFYAGPLDPSLYLTRAYAPLERRLRAYIDYARAVPRAAAQVRANLRTPMPRSYAQVGRTALGGLADYYESDVPGIFAAIEDTSLQEELRAANAAAAAAMRDLGSWFTALEQESADDGYALGAERFRKMLRDTERVDLPLEALEAAGRRDLERNLAAMRAACAALAPGKPLAECVAMVQAEKPAAGPVEAARSQLAGLRRFIEGKELVTIPGSEEAQIAEAPSYLRWNSAFIDIPGPYDRHLPSIYYISPPDPSWSPEERAAYVPGEADLLFVTIHEVWPGHFLQFLHSNRADSEPGRLFVSYGFAEGWAHYAEELMWEAGFGEGDPKLHIGQLQNALLRNVRFLVALGLHTGGMTLDEAERMFLEMAFQDAASARQQAARGSFDPAYLNYTLGKLIVRKLRDDWTAARGGRNAWRAFHDTLLSFGGPPLPLVRRAMLGREEGPLL